jgi:tetratricopeptide (TPR) repeat protein
VVSISARFERRHITISKIIHTILRFAEAYYWQARVYFETGDYQQAIQNYRKVLEIEPDNAKAEYWLKESQRQLGTKQ